MLLPYFSCDDNTNDKTIISFLKNKIRVNNNDMLKYIKFLMDDEDGGENPDYSYLLINKSDRGKLSCQILSLDESIAIA